MKRLTHKALALFAVSLLCTSFAFAAPKRARRTAVAKCVGASNCRACKNCRYCKHCSKDGGTCGVCRRGRSGHGGWQEAKAHATH